MGVRVLRDDRGRIQSGFQRLVYESLREAALFCVDRAVSFSPKDDGELANSIRADKVGSYHWVVGVFVAYAAYVELGTRDTAAQPYLLPAFLLARQMLISTIGRGVTESGSFGNGSRIVRSGKVA